MNEASPNRHHSQLAHNLYGTRARAKACHAESQIDTDMDLSPLRSLVMSRSGLQIRLNQIAPGAFQYMDGHTNSEVNVGS